MVSLLLAVQQEAHADVHPLILSSGQTLPSLAGHIWLWVDPTSQAGLAEAEEAWRAGRFQRHPYEDIKQGYDPARALWARISIQSTHESPRSWWLTIPRDLPDEVIVYTVREGAEPEVRSGGRAYPQSTKELDWRGLAFRLALSDHAPTTLFLRATSQGALHFTVRVQEERAFQRMRTWEDLAYGAMYGVFVLVGLLGFLRGLWFQSLVDLLYAGYISTAVIVQGVMGGYAKQLGFVDALWTQIVLNNCGLLASLTCFCWIATLLISWPEPERTRARVLARLFTLVTVGGPILSLTAFRPYFPIVANQISIVDVGVIIVLVGSAALRNFGNARALAVAFAPMLFIVGIGLLSTRGLVQTHIVTAYNAMNVASILHALLILMAILSRDANVRRQQEQQLRNERETLEVRVAERTQELSRREGELRTILQNAPLPMLVVRRSDTRILYVNIHAAALAGTTVQELEGKSAIQFYRTPEERTVLRAVYAHQGALTNHELCLNNAQGGPLWVSTSMVPIVFEDEPADLISLVDITERKAREEALHQLASIDPLTGIWNRRRLEELIAQLRSTSEQGGPASSVLIFDVDHFKRINDSLGHAAGDDVLRALVQGVRGTLRTCDLLARWGGEEFVIFCPNTALNAATVLAERIRDKVANLTLFADRTVTISIGCTEILAGEPWDACFNRADRALYQAKQEGRNRVKIAVPPRSPPDPPPESL